MFTGVSREGALIDYTAPMPSTRSAQLSLMMFLNYVVWGAWYVTLGTYLTATLHFSGTETGAVFGTTALASMITPFFVGMIADRFFATEKMLAVLHLVGAVLLYLVTTVTSFGAVYGIMLAYCLCYFPTIALTNSLALKQITDAGRQFPLIRVFGTIGWIVIGQVLGWLAIEKSAKMFLLAAGASVVMAIYSLTLPHTPPAGAGEPITARALLGFDALVMLKQRTYLVFILAMILGCIPLTFYFTFTNAYLNEIGVVNAAGKMTLGQASEIVAMLLMPLVFRKMSVRAIIMLGLLSWSLRYGLLAYGNAGAGMWMFYIAILLHGVCFDFFFMTGQLYADQEAPSHLRVTAQGFLTFVTYGVGMFIGSLLSGVALDWFTTKAGVAEVHDWRAFWLSSAAGSFVILMMVALFFRSRSRIESKQA
jgi:nucleoside transporter